MESSVKIQNSRKIVKFVIILMLIIMAIVLAGIAYARYVTSLNGNTTAEIAKWSFKVVDGDSSTIDVLDFPITRTDNNTEVDSSTIAPGTYGVFEIDVDARGTETILNYEISIGFTNKPQNMKFYTDENMTNEIQLDNNGRLVLSRFLSLDDVNQIQSNLIYWNWALETGNTAQEIEQNDLLDSQFMGKRLSMAVTVTGTQAIQGGATVTYDKNYFENDLLKESDIIRSEYKYNHTGAKNVQILNNEEAKYGKTVKCIMNESSAGFNEGIFTEGMLIDEGKTYTWKAYVKTNTDRRLRIGVEEGGHKYITSNSEYQQVTRTFTATLTTQAGAFLFYNYGEIWHEDDTLEFHSLELMEGEPTYYRTTIEKNTKLGTTITPTRNGYEFLGWYTDPVAGNEVNANTTITQDTTLYAHWRFIE